MPIQTIFGAGLASSVRLGDLGDSDMQAARWTLQRHEHPAPAREGTRIGTSEVFPGVFGHLDRCVDGGFRFTVDDAGTFDISPDGRSFEWYPIPAPSPASSAAGETYVTNILLPLSVHLAGGHCLHASAVAFGDMPATARGVAFCAPKFHGKSTLTMASVRAGAKLVTDDTLAVTIGANPQLLPGVHAVRLFADSASHLGEIERVEGLTVMSEKHVIIPTGSIMTEPVAFSAAYVLRPVTHLQSGAAVERILLSKREAVTLFLGHSKIQNLFDGVERMSILDRASVLTEIVPAYRLDIVRDLARLSEVTDTMARWHAEDVAPEGPA